MNTLQLFQFPDFKGASVPITEDTADVRSVGFPNKAESFKITGDPWFVFSEANYKGKFKGFKQGNYNPIPGFQHNISSVKRVKSDLLNPKITLYEDINYGGESINLDRPAVSLRPYKFVNKASSHKSVSGAWVLYEGESYSGDQTVTLAGDEIPDYRKIGWKVSSLRSLTPYEVYK